MGILICLLVIWLLLLSASIKAQYRLRLRGTFLAGVCVLLLFLVPVIPFALAGFLVIVKHVFGDAPLFFQLRYFIVAGAKGPALAVFCIVVAPHLGFWAFSSWRLSRQRRSSQELERGERPARWPDAVVLIGMAVFAVTAVYLRGYVTLDDAVRKGDVDLVKRRLEFNLLGLSMENGCVDEVSYMLFLQPVLPLAVGIENREVILLLLEKGASKDWCLVQGPEGPHVGLLLESSVRRGKTEMLLFLLEQGSRPNATDTRGDTLLHVAAREDRAEAAAVLLRYGADPDIRNHEGPTPLDVARKEDSASVVAALASLADG